MNSETNRPELIEQQLNRDACERFFYFCLAFAGMFAVYGFSSFDFLKIYQKNLSLLDNVWPRVLLNSFPFLLLAYFLKKSTWDARHKINISLVSLCLIFDLAAMIYVWPIAYGGFPEIILYVHADNMVCFGSIIIMLGLNLRQNLLAYGLLTLLVWLPLAYVLYHGAKGNSLLMVHVLSDTFFLQSCCLALGLIMNKGRFRLAELEYEKNHKASLFLGPVVSKAIYQNDQSIFKTETRTGFLLSLDLRDSTENQKKYGERWLEFRQKYFKLVTAEVNRFGGYIQKTVGDCHVVNFGIVDYLADLSDIPGIENDLARSEERRLKKISENVFSCLDSIFLGFHKLAFEYFQEDSVRLGAGVDKGKVEKSLQGDGQNQLELDVNGDPVNCCSRLQEYTKNLAGQFSKNSSLLLISPFACDYLQEEEFLGLKRIQTLEEPIRNYSNIRWVMLKEYTHQMALRNLPNPEYKKAA